MAAGGGDGPSKYWTIFFGIVTLLVSLISLVMPLMMGTSDRVSHLERQVTALCDRSAKPCP